MDPCTTEELVARDLPEPCCKCFQTVQVLCFFLSMVAAVLIGVALAAQLAYSHMLPFALSPLELGFVPWTLPAYVYMLAAAALSLPLALLLWRQLGADRMKILASLAGVASDMCLDWYLVLWKFPRAGHWKWACFGILLLVVPAAVKCGRDFRGGHSATHAVSTALWGPFAVLGAGYECLLEGDPKGPAGHKFAALRFEESVFEAFPQFVFQAYILLWSSCQRAACSHREFADHTYWMCEKVAEMSWQQAVSVSASFAMLVLGSAQWCKRQYDAKGMTRPTYMWLFAVFFKALPLMSPAVMAAVFFDSPPSKIPEQFAMIGNFIGINSGFFISCCLLPFFISRAMRLYDGRKTDMMATVQWSFAWVALPMSTPLPEIGAPPASTIKALALSMFYIGQDRCLTILGLWDMFLILVGADGLFDVFEKYMDAGIHRSPLVVTLFALQLLISFASLLNVDRVMQQEAPCSGATSGAWTSVQPEDIDWQPLQSEEQSE